MKREPLSQVGKLPEPESVPSQLVPGLFAPTQPAVVLACWCGRPLDEWVTSALPDGGTETKCPCGAVRWVQLEGGTLDVGIVRDLASAFPGKPRWFVRLVAHRPLWWARRWLGYSPARDLEMFRVDG